MTTTTVPDTSSAAPQAPVRPAPRRRPRSRWGEHLMHAYTWLILLWLVAPIIFMIVFSFNDTHSRQNTHWQGFTFKWWGRLGAYPDLTDSLVNSLTIALFSTVIATVFGTMIGMAMGKHTFRGQGGLNLLMFANIAAPEVVLGSSLLSLFVTMNLPRGYLTILIAHVMFNLAYVAVVVSTRLASFDMSLEEAARDLGAGPWATFRLVTFPIILPGILSGAMLAFSMSIDEYIITAFNAGGTLTFPLWVMGATKNGVPPQVNVMATIIFVGGILLSVGGFVLGRGKKTRAPEEDKGVVAA